MFVDIIDFGDITLQSLLRPVVVLIVLRGQRQSQLVEYTCKRGAVERQILHFIQRQKPLEVFEEYGSLIGISGRNGLEPTVVNLKEIQYRGSILRDVLAVRLSLYPPIQDLQEHLRPITQAHT